MPESAKARILAKAEGIESEALRSVETTTDGLVPSSDGKTANLLQTPANEAYRSALKMMERILASDAAP